MAYRILIVDDEPALQSMVKEILTQAGYQTDAALNCAAALERFSAAAPDSAEFSPASRTISRPPRAAPTATST